MIVIHLLPTTRYSINTAMLDLLDLIISCLPTTDGLSAPLHTTSQVANAVKEREH